MPEQRTKHHQRSQAGTPQVAARQMLCLPKPWLLAPHRAKQTDPGEPQFLHSSCHAKHNYTRIASPPQPTHLTPFPSSSPCAAGSGRVWFHPTLLRSCAAHLASPPLLQPCPPGEQEAAAGPPQAPGSAEQEPLLLPPLLSSPLRVTRKSPCFCCQSIFDSSANLTLFSSL